MRRVMFVPLLFVALHSAAQPDLTGLWCAKLRFGPDARGTLTIDQRSSEIAGRSASVRREGNAISFELPTGEGRFRGVESGTRIDGHWIQPRGVSTGHEIATPVTLVRDDTARWRGMVTPIDDAFTMSLPITRQSDGTLATFVRNPERNVGRFMNVDRIALDGNWVKLLRGDKVEAEGTYDAENAVMTIGLRGQTYDFHRATAAEEAQFYPRGRSPAPYAYRVPPSENDGWPVASLDAEHIAGAAIERFIQKIIDTPIADVHASDVHAVIIARHGRLVLEEYFHGFHRDAVHDTRSAAKSLTSFLAGAASVDPGTPVYATMYGDDKNLDPRKRAITLEHLLAMSSGLDCDDADDQSPGNEGVMQDQTAQPDWYRYTLDLKMIRNPGEKSVYCSCNANLAGGVLARKTGQWLPDLFRDLVASPLGIERYGMNLTPTGDAYMGGGTQLRLRDFMKLGQVILDGGSWRGKRILSAEWAKRSTSAVTEIAGRKYGYLWWVQDYPYNDRTVRAFFAGGNGGQIVMGIPELELLIGFNGGNYSDPALFIPQRVYVPELILPAVK